MPLELAFEVTGEGPPVVILHGMFGSGTNWRTIAQRLSDSARVYCVDLRNHGRSPWSESMDYLEMAADVEALIEAQGLVRPAVMGHSMGGKVAMALALSAPSTIGRLVAVDIAPVSYVDRMSSYVDAMRGIDVVHAASRTEIRKSLAASVHDAGIVGFLMQNLVERNQHFDWRVNLLAIAAAMPTLCSFPPALRERRFDGIAEAIAGADSNYVDPDGAPFEPMFPAIRLQMIPEAGHWVHADRPEAFLTAARLALSLPPSA